MGCFLWFLSAASGFEHQMYLSSTWWYNRGKKVCCWFKEIHSKPLSTHKSHTLGIFRAGTTFIYFLLCQVELHIALIGEEKIISGYHCNGIKPCHSFGWLDDLGWLSYYTWCERWNWWIYLWHNSNIYLLYNLLWQLLLLGGPGWDIHTGTKSARLAFYPPLAAWY